MRRRDVIALLGGAAAAWSVVARAQQTVMPVVGFLNVSSADPWEHRLRALRQGLKDNGFVEGENVAIEYRWAEDRLDRLPELAADLVRRRVAVIVVSTGIRPALVAKAATSTIPIVFIAGDDPVRHGLVASLPRPGSNVTGINFVNVELAAKRLELMRELVPAAAHAAVLVNPANTSAETTVRETQAAGRSMGMQIRVLNAGTSGEIDAAFASLARERPDVLFVSGDGVFTARRTQLVNLASHRSVLTTFPNREFTEIGGLMSYGSNLTDGFRQLGGYAARILKGAKPADLPVVQASKFELVINHQTARMFGLSVPSSLLARADEVIE